MIDGNQPPNSPLPLEEGQGEGIDKGRSWVSALIPEWMESGFPHSVRTSRMFWIFFGLTSGCAGGLNRRIHFQPGGHDDDLTQPDFHVIPVGLFHHAIGTENVDLRLIREGCQAAHFV